MHNHTTLWVCVYQNMADCYWVGIGQRLVNGTGVVLLLWVIASTQKGGFRKMKHTF